jgi:hypothetical protein
VIKARELVDISQFQLHESDARLDAGITASVAVYSSTGLPDTPALLLPIGMLRGRVPDLKTLRELLMKHVSSKVLNPSESIALR